MRSCCTKRGWLCVVLSVVVFAGQGGPDCAQAAEVARDNPAQHPAGQAPTDKRSPPDVHGTAEQQNATELVDRLGHDSWQERNKAAAVLTALGPKALHALKAGLEHPDPHVRRQSRRLLLEVLEKDYERRLAAFVAGKDDAFDSPLPGWRHFSSLVGSDQMCRELFADMYRAESPLLERVELRPKEAGELVFGRLSQLGPTGGLAVQHLARETDAQRVLSSLSALQALAGDVPQIAVMLFVLGHPEVDPHLHYNTARIAVVRSISSLLVSGDCAERINSHKYRRAMQRLLCLWLKTPEHIDVLPQKLALIDRYGLEEMLPWALEVVLVCQHHEPPISGFQRQQLVMEATKAIATVGGKKHAAALERLLECDAAVLTVGSQATVLGRQSTEGWSVQIRDVALAWLIYLTGQDFEHYGLRQAKTAFEQLKRNPRSTPALTSIRLDDQSRQKALGLWAAYTAKNPLPELPAQYKMQPAKVQILAPFSVALHSGNAELPGRTAVAPQEPGVALAERSVVALLKTAEELCARGDFARAVDILLRILAQPNNAAFQPETGLGLFRFTKVDASRLLRGLPAEGQRVMRLHCADTARHELNTALASGNRPAVAAVAEKYFGTEAGSEAALLAAAAALSAGRPLQGAAILDRVQREVTITQRREPELSVWLAICWLRAGCPDEARQALAGAAEYAGREAVVLGAPVRLFARPQAGLEWLEKHLGLAAGEAQTLDTFGGRLGDKAAGVGTPHLRGQMLMPLTSDAQIAQWLHEARRADALECRPALPRIPVLVAGQIAVARTLTHIAAVDVTSGQLLWENPLYDALGELLDRRWRSRGEPSPQPLSPESLAAALRRRVWEDGAFGALTSNGRYVFGVEDLPCGLGPQHKRIVIDFNGMRRWQSEPARPTSNVLTAYDLRTGKLVWEIGEPSGNWQPAAGAFFLGPPLALGNSLFVLAEIEEEIRLLELRADTGALVAETVLASRLKAPGSALWPLPYRPSNVLRRQALTPAFADGVLVCQTSENDFAAIDLATRQLLWIYSLPEDETGPSRRQVLLMMRGTDSPPAHQTPEWLDSAVVLAGDTAVIAPRHANRLLAIGLRHGQLLWSVPRRDTLWVGDTDGERVVLVGRAGLRAIRLADGNPAWPDDHLPLPSGAAPGGRGIVAEGRFHLPLSTGGLLVVDMETGQPVAECRMWNDLPPGNLVAFPDGVVSANIEGLVRFDPVRRQLQQLEAALQQRPEDADLLAEYAAALIADSRPAEAFEHLLRSLKLRPSDTARVLLVEAITQGLRSDFAAFSKLVPRARSLLENTDQFQAAMRVWGGALREHGQIASALEAYLAAAAAESSPGGHLPAESLRRVRRDRLWAAQLAATYAAAEQAQRSALDELIAAQLHGQRGPQMLAFLGWHPAAHAVRVQLAAGRLAQQQPLRAELLLRQVIVGGTPDQQRAAAALLASLLRDTGNTLEAAEVYRFLMERWPEEICLEGKTAQELVRRLPAGDPVRKLLDMRQTWPSGQVYIEALAAPRQSATTAAGWMIVIPIDTSPGRPVSHAMIDTSMMLTLADAQGRQRARLQLERSSAMISSPLLYAQTHTIGRLVLVFAGHQLTALMVGQDVQDGAKTLWSRAVPTGQSLGQGMIWAIARGSGHFAMPASAGLPVAVSMEAVCLLGDRKLIALDPITGETLWVRDGMPASAALFGDEYRLVVAPGDGSEAEVLDMLDGRTVARCTVPPANQRMWTLGTQVVTWETAHNSGTLGLYDPLEGKYLWQRKYQHEPRAWPISPQEAAVCDHQGQLEIVALPSGRVVCAAQLDSTPRLRDLVVHKAAGHYVAIVNRGAEGLISAAGPTISIEGVAYGIDASTGMLRWSAECSRCGFRPGGPADIPLLVLEQSGMVQERGAYRQLHKLMCIDLRDGQVLLDRELTGRSSGLHRLISDPEGRRIELLGPAETFRFHFTDEPHPRQNGSAK